MNKGVEERGLKRKAYPQPRQQPLMATVVILVFYSWIEEKWAEVETAEFQS